MKRITLEASCDGRSISCCMTEMEVRYRISGHRVHHFMIQVMHYYSDEAIRLKLTLPNGSTHAVQNVQVTDKKLQDIAEQWIIKIKDALV